VSQYFWPEVFRINEVAASLVERGVDVEVLTGKPNYPEGNVYDGYRIWGFHYEQFGGVKISRVPLIPRGNGRGYRVAINYLSFILFGTICGAWMQRRKRYDVIFVYGLSPILLALPALFLAWLKRSPVVIWVQDLWPQSLSATGYVRNSLVLQLFEIVVRYIYKRADLLLVQSQAFLEPVCALAPATPIAYYPNSVDSSFAAPATVQAKEVPGLDAPFAVLFAGNIGTAQAVDVIVHAATRLRNHSDIQFVVLGDGSRRDWMLEEVAVRKLTNLHVPGRFPVETMPAFMQKASALLVTLADREIFGATVPNKVQAYMAAGRPIIACLPGEGARLVMEAGAGVEVPAGDGSALADAVLSLSRMSKSERDTMGRNGRTYFQKHFCHETLIDQLIAHLKMVVGKKD
jgi:glycosyltransferase involved in cell wall biosynthesis